MKIVPLAAFSAALLSAPLAWAQDPTFTYADDKTKQEVAEVKEVEWKVLALGGLVLTTGNAPLTSMSGGAKASRKQSGNKFQIETGGTYARSTVFVPVDVGTDVDNDGMIDNNMPDGLDDDGKLTEQTATTNKLLFAKARYDRFLTEFNSLYVTGSYLKDEPAGKDHVAGGQVGYSRLLLKRENQELVSEVGYDFSFEVPVGDDGVAIHSARVLLGYAVKLSPDTGIDAAVEGLFNVNGIDLPDGSGRGVTIDVEAFEDTRFNGKLGISTKLFENISFRFGFEARFDNAPSYRAGVKVKTLDTKTEASIIVTLL
ncbi:MAG: hypothetical protein Tsb0020_31360 [Haliangiales bacterium]